MGKKRVPYDFNDPKPPDINNNNTNNDNVVIDHHHHHHHRHHNHQKSRKIKPEAKLLHTLNSHLKKLAKSRSRNMARSLSPTSSTVVSHDNNKHHHHGHVTSSLKHDHHHRFHRRHDWFTGFDSDHEDDGGMMRVGDHFGQEFCWKTTSLLAEDINCEDLFGGESVFAPDLNVSQNLMVVFEEDGSGYIPDPVMNLDNADHDGKYLYDILELSSQEDMINEFLKSFTDKKESTFFPRMLSYHFKRWWQSIPTVLRLFCIAQSTYYESKSKFPSLRLSLLHWELACEPSYLLDLSSTRSKQKDSFESR